MIFHHNINILIRLCDFALPQWLHLTLFLLLCRDQYCLELRQSQLQALFQYLSIDLIHLQFSCCFDRCLSFFLSMY